tara:strand:- start:23151 stop:23390 length:240 start_codon:yes stop_codon:yes gene_type:complete
MDRNKKRYVVTMDMYVYAENDYMARKRAHKMIEVIDEKYVNARPAVTELMEQQFGTIGFRRLNDISKPVSNKKEEELPF